jgi:uncharacterized protein (TIGR02597 family)
MKFLQLLPTLGVAASFAVGGLHAQTTATTDPVGFMTIDLPVGSDTVVAAPLTKPPVFQGAVSSLNSFTITSTGADFGDLTSLPHYVQAIDGTQAGMIFDIASNTTDTITLVNNGVTPSGLTANTQFKVVPYWTLSQLFPSSDQGVSFTPSASASGPARRTQILTPNVTGTGINRAAGATYYFVTNSYWRSTTGSTNNFNNTPLLPDSYFIVRNTTNSASGLKLTVAGNVNTGKMAVQLDSVASTQNDNYVSLGRPTDITLNDLGLISSGAFLPSASASGPARRDQLLVFNNASIGFNKSASATYYYLSNATTQGWRSSSTGTNDVGSTIIPAAVGYVIRKATNNGTGTTFWTNQITIAE